MSTRNTNPWWISLSQTAGGAAHNFALREADDEAHPAANRLISLSAATSSNSFSKMHNIREHSWGFQLYIKRGGIEYQPCYSIRAYGNRSKALEAVRSRRDQLLAVMPQQPRARTKPITGKRSTGVAGVSRRFAYDKRRNATYLRYDVHWRQGKIGRCRGFSVGRVEHVTPDLEFHAFRSAMHFRRIYMMCLEADIPFCPEWFDGWQDREVYHETYGAISTEKESEVERGFAAA